MPKPIDVLSTNITIKVDGATLQPKILDHLLEVVVDQTMGMPSMFTIRLRDNRLEFVDGSPFDLGKAVMISADNGNNTSVELIKGEVTALEPSFGGGKHCELLVRGYDKSHRLFRETRTEAYIDKKDSDIAKTIAGNAGLGSNIDATTVIYKHLYQSNQTDLAFLRERAWRIGYECFVADGTLYFRKQKTGSAETTLEWGDGYLISFEPRMTVAEQVNEVLVSGWDPKSLKKILGKSNKTTYSATPYGTGASKGKPFGNAKQIIVDQPVISESEAKQLAQARLDELNGTIVDATGLAFRSPEITAGKLLKLDKLGKRFSDTYMVTAACHRYNHQGLYTEFSVSGKRNHSVTAQMMGRDPVQRWTGVVSAIVTDTEDSEKQGRVKVTYPWLNPDEASGWARWAAPAAGAESGIYAMPAIDEEVLVAFEHGDFNWPIIIGRLWNGKHAIPPDAADAPAGEESTVHVWQTHTGHKLVMREDSGNERAELITSAGHMLQLDDANKRVLLETTGGHILELEDNGKNIKLKNSGGALLEMDGNTGHVTLKTSGNITIKGMKIELNATDTIDIKGMFVNVSAKGPLNLKGAVVNLN